MLAKDGIGTLPVEEVAVARAAAEGDDGVVFEVFAGLSVLPMEGGEKPPLLSSSDCFSAKRSEVMLFLSYSVTGPNFQANRICSRKGSDRIRKFRVLLSPQ